MPTKQDIESVYQVRQSRRDHPTGRMDSGGRWYPSDDEYCVCCDYVRSPSRRWPWSYMIHCRTKKHIANLLRKRELAALAATQHWYEEGYGLL
jgi:hypothetical protein